MPSRAPHIERVAARPRSLFVDSGAWIALQSRRDQYHSAAERLFQDALSRRIPLFTTDLVIAEAHRFILFRAGARPALRALDLIDASPSVEIRFAGPDDNVAARRWLVRLAPRPVTYADSVSFAVMERSRCRHVLGFDQDFAVAGFTLWTGG